LRLAAWDRRVDSPVFHQDRAIRRRTVRWHIERDCPFAREYINGSYESLCIGLLFPFVLRRF